MNDAFITKLYDEVKSLYRLDQIGKKTEGEETEKRQLPKESVALLILIPCVWALILSYKLWQKKKTRGKN